MPSQHDDCVFCDIVRNGTYVAKTKGFVAINDINPKAQTHLLIIPERHVDSFREIGHFGAGDTKRMLEFIAETARGAGLTDYRIEVNVGRSAGQTVFHLHWHVLGDVESHIHIPNSLTAVTEL
ncbi:MAG: HIT domain-containing protein [Actinobacteria bacterium]|nr:HIT domain-containing protein [Actinomycetota bacterium]MBV8394988.1 HIT domain-containing protein [Actinomycetota bacterium]MBV8598247.1 HIT domain-containing protein [Actinomycetota bacterium]